MLQISAFRSSRPCVLSNLKMFSNQITARVTPIGHRGANQNQLLNIQSKLRKRSALNEMALCYLFLGLLNLIPQLWGYEGFYYRDAAGVGRYGLEGLSMDILEKIKHATGYPIKTNIFAGIISAPSKGYTTLHLGPYKLSKLGKRSRKKGGKKSLGGGGGHKSHGKYKKYSDSGESGKSGKEKWGESYEENSGKKDDFMHESEFTDDFYHKEEGEKGNEFKGGHKKDRAFVSKGFEDVYHKDETKEADSFWENEEKEGKWVKYGSKKKKHEKKVKKKVGDEKKKEGKEGREYKSSKKHGSEKRDKMSAKKERKNSVDSEHSKKEIEIESETKL